MDSAMQLKTLMHYAYLYQGSLLKRKVKTKAKKKSLGKKKPQLLNMEDINIRFRRDNFLIIETSTYHYSLTDKVNFNTVL
jgi:hypothetical protein